MQFSVRESGILGWLRRRLGVFELEKRVRDLEISKKRRDEERACERRQERLIKAGWSCKGQLIRLTYWDGLSQRSQPHPEDLWVYEPPPEIAKNLSGCFTLKEAEEIQARHEGAKHNRELGRQVRRKTTRKRGRKK